uniref:Peptidase_M16 domain-containing protein n=1 Tax=Steinernema glaseri TaxID=37863 RepID=A0A1I7Y955_9BILA
MKHEILRYEMYYGETHVCMTTALMEYGIAETGERVAAEAVMHLSWCAESGGLRGTDMCYSGRGGSGQGAHE